MEFVIEQPLNDALAAAIRVMRHESIQLDAIYIVGQLGGHQVTVTVEEVSDETHVAVLGREGVAKRATVRALNSVRRTGGDGRIG